MTSGGDAADPDLSRQLAELSATVGELRAEVRRNAGAMLPAGESAGWEDGAGGSSPASHAWVSSVVARPRAPVRIPRLPLELAFVAAAAVLAGVADLRPVEIVGVMAVAWVVVGLAEWAGSRGDRMRAQIYLSPVVTPAATQLPSQPDPTWFTPPVEHTLLTPADDQATAIAKLPPLEDPELTLERRPDA